MESPEEDSPTGGTTSQIGSEDCQFCDEIDLVRDSDAEERKEVSFHEHCSTCVPPDPSLCGRCQHLRLRHLLFCNRDRTDFWDIQMDGWMNLVNHSTSSDCTLCSFILQIAQQLRARRGILRMTVCDRISLEVRTTGGSHYLDNGSKTSRETVKFGIMFGHGTLVESVGHDLRRTPRRADTGTESFHSRCPDGDGDSFPRSWLVKELIDWNSLKDQLAVCYAKHEGCHQKHSPLPSGFRLIDVEDRCIVHARSDAEFLALSYVWGTKPDGHEHKRGVLVESCVEELERQGSLRPSDLPATIEDAIQACVTLGERYLWVDRLCIVQDDLKNKSHQIHAMGNIFASAKLVIIAVGAEDMHSGICGISKVRRNNQISTEFSKMELVHSLPHKEDCLNGSVWSSRAWTYQEAVLARRKLWLTCVQAFYECSVTVFHEDKIGNTLPWHLLSHFSDIETYFHHLRQYTTRSLTFDSGIYNAFTGICNSIFGGDSLIFGLPHDEFDQALLWQPVGPDTATHRDCCKEDLVLPSWTWASVKGQVYGDRYWCFCGTLVKWLVCKGSEEQPSLLPIKAGSASLPWSRPEDEFQPSPELYIAVAWGKNCIQNSLPTSLQIAGSITFAELEQSAKSHWTSYSSFCEEQYPGWIDGNGNPAGVTTQLKPGVLVGRAQTANLTANTFLERPEGIFNDNVFLRDHRNRVVGAAGLRVSTCLDDPVTRIKAVALSVSCSILEDRILLQFQYPRLQGLKRREFRTARKKLYQDRCENWTFFDSEGHALLPPPMINLMLVEEHGKYYRRIGLGWAYLSRWTQAAPVFETILLE